LAEPQRAIPFTGELVAYIGTRALACQAAALWSTGVLLYPPIQTLPDEPLRLVIKLYEIGKQIVVNGTVCQELNHGGHYAWRVELVDPPPGVTELLGQYVAAKLAAPIQRTPTGPFAAVPRQHAVTGPHTPVVRGADPLCVTGPQTPVAHDPLGVTGSQASSSSENLTAEGYEVNLGEAPIVERGRSSATAVPERPRLAGPGFYGASRNEPEAPKRPESPLQKVASRLGIGMDKKADAPAPPARPARLGKPIPRPAPAPALKVKGGEADIDLDEGSGASARRDLVKDLDGYSKSPNRLQDLFRAALKDVE
jgi:hypothetical protein